MRFVIKHKHKGYFMQGSTHLRNRDRFSQDLQEAKIFLTKGAASSSVSANLAKPLQIADPTFVDNIEIIPVYLSLSPDKKA